MKAIKITNPLYLQYAAPEIKKYIDKLKSKTIFYESFMTYLQNTAQFGGNISEVWMVIKDDYPIAFAQWNLMPTPHVGAWSLNHACSWAKDKAAFDLLIDECMKYGWKHNCTHMLGDANGKKLLSYFKSKATERNLVIETCGMYPFVLRKGENYGK